MHLRRSFGHLTSNYWVFEHSIEYGTNLWTQVAPPTMKHKLTIDAVYIRNVLYCVRKWAAYSCTTTFKKSLCATLISISKCFFYKSNIINLLKFHRFLPIWQCPIAKKSNICIEECNMRKKWRIYKIKWHDIAIATHFLLATLLDEKLSGKSTT